ncbi:MAG TPA: helix-turn-helix transcriptional regulator [Ktedonobacteraceae bacterium]|nr:helix-turn-helix transcriptional regulator [Ktedonobacteraceae bacterium]
MERARLSQARHKKFWTLEEAAERIGVDPASLSRWEKGKSFPQPVNVQRLCNAYGMTAQQLGLEDEPLPEYGQNVLPVEDALTLFQQQDLTLRLMRVVGQWNHQSTRYSVLQTLITQELEDSMNEDPQAQLSRRDALRRLALLPVELLGLSAVGVVLKYPTEDILAQCAAGITACWHLRRGKELLFASDTVTRYLPTLKAIAHGASSTQRKAAADLIAQGYLLKGLLARHVEGYNEAIAYTRQAAIYGEAAENSTLQILALRTQGAAHYYANHWTQALHAAEQAGAVLETSKAPIPPLARSYVYAGLASYQAGNGLKQEAFQSLGKAHTAFFAQPPDEPAPVWIDHYQANLVLHDGMTHYHLGLQKEALNSFEQIHLDPAKTETVRVEALLNQVMAEVNRADTERDMAWCIDRWIQGIEGAKALQSEQRFNESLHAYSALCAAWPSEPHIKELRAYITHW